MVTLSDIEHAMIKYLKTFEQYSQENIGPEKFTDGWAFATILRAAANFKISYGDLIESSQKWTFKLTNLKKIVSLIEQYFEVQINKAIKTKDIDLIEIAKNNNIEEIVKLFEVVIAVLTEAPNKEDHINTIMSLDERSQSTFVSIIQNVLESRIIDKKDSSKQNLMMIENSQLQNQSTLLKQEIEAILQHNYTLEKEMDEYKMRLKDYQDEVEELRGQKIDRQVPLEENKQKQHLKNMVDNLKDKLLCTVRDHEMKISAMKEQIQILQNKLIKYENMEEQLEEYKIKYSETIQLYGKSKNWEREKSKLTKVIEEKEEIIKSLNQKLQQANESNYAMQEKQLYTKLELEKRDIRFKELERQVKKKHENLLGKSEPTLSHTSNPQTGKYGQEMIDNLQEQLDELRPELDQVNRKLRESERENNRLKRGMDKVNSMEQEKKKLQRLILDVSNEKKEQVELLLSVTYDFYAENLRLKDILEANKIAC